ncbi:MAG: hypothetical protein SFV23_20255 [Planctomycetaceae bacterium]|nr:hypothetical protein [Planctomycetaceae bacterium]
MSVKVRCTGCDKVLTAPDSARGKAIKCPACDTKVRVPAGEEKPKKKRAEEPADSEDALATLDLRNVEDHEARICGKCGYDMQHMDEEETECPKCGYDSSRGGLGEKAQKKRLKGPDPDKFYSGLWKANWKFVIKNQGLAWRTIAYVIVASMLMFLCAFLYLYVPQWPPRIFFAMCGFVSAMMIPGWLWFLDEQVVTATLQKKDVLKRVNFDFFLCSALGMKFIAWNVVFALPIVLIPALVGYAMNEVGGLPWQLAAIPILVGYLPVFAMLPICVGHFVMPVPTPGWLVWKVFPAWLRTLKPTLIWLMLTLGLCTPSIGCLAAAGAVYGSAMSTAVSQMDENCAISRAKLAKERASKKDQAKLAGNPLVDKQLHKIDYSAFIVPSILWTLACLFLGFPAVYSSRLNGQFVYFFRDSLDLIALAKEYKYVAKPQKDEDEEIKPKTLVQVAVESVVTTFICLLVGGIGGMLYGSLNDDVGIGLGIVSGAFYGCSFAMTIGRIMLLSASFKENVGWGLIVLLLPFGDVAYVATHWEDGAPGCLVTVVGGFMFTFIIILAIAGVVTFASLGLGGGDDVGQPPAPIDGAAGASIIIPDAGPQRLAGMAALEAAEGALLAV